MTRGERACTLVVAFVAFVAAGATIGSVPVLSGAEQSLPVFEVEASWPKLPDKMIYGALGGIDVDSHDHIWILNRPRTLTKGETYAALVPPMAECCVPAPPVMEFDAAGNYLQGWGGPGPGYEWPEIEHGIHVDYRGNVWIAGSGAKDNQVLKFTASGELLMQIGHAGQSAGSNDTANFARPTDIYVNQVSNEAFVSDGYVNRRVIVFDADTGAYKRHWGAFGSKPDDAVARGRVVEGSGKPADTAQGVQAGGAWLKQFNTVHAVRISNDQLVYVGDRGNDRVQVFRPDGTFIKEAFVSTRSNPPPGTGTAGGLAFSADKEQRFLYVSDSSNQVVWILSRDTLQILGKLGRQGRNAGQFDLLHFVAADSHGNIYTAEFGGRRAQKFLYKGVSAVSIR